jgi:hypothetical protein
MNNTSEKNTYTKKQEQFGSYETGNEEGGRN